MRLASVLDRSGRDVKVGNSRVLDRMDIDLLGRLAMEGRVRDWIDHGYTCCEKDGNDQILEKIGITNLGMALTSTLSTFNALQSSSSTVERYFPSSLSFLAPHS